MYLREVHAELDIPTLHQFIRDNPLGLLTTAIPSDTYPLLQATHIPWVLDPDRGSQGYLRGHLAKQNPHAKAITQAETLDEFLIIFTGTTHYVPPKFYTATKPTTGKVVPTWNYSSVEVRGKARLLKSDELLRQVEDLSRFAETSVMGYSKPWLVSDAPENYINALLKVIMGVEIEITSITGRIKMSQESPKEDRMGVVEGFRKLGTQVGDEMAKTVQARSDLKDAKQK